MSRRHIEDRVRHIAWPGPSPGLRDRVLSAATVAEFPISWSDRVWFSRAWRLAAVMAAVAVIAIDQFGGPSSPTRATSTAQALAEARAIAEVGREAGLPADAAEALARRALSGTSAFQMPSQSVSALLRTFELENEDKHDD